MIATTNMSMTESCARRILAMREKQNNPQLMLRITILGGGCSGFKYTLEFDDKVNDDDLTVEKNGALIVTDEASAPFLADAVIDYEQNLMGSAFKIKNPNAASSCGCGKSFATM